MNVRVRRFRILASAIAIASSGALLSFGGSARAEDTKSEKQQVLKPGTPAPVFRLRALDGAIVRLDDLAYPGKEKAYAKKRPILLDFFRTDCVACRKAMPELIALQKKHQSDGLDVILVALLEEEDGRTKLERYLAEAKLPLRIAVDEAEHFAKKYLGDPVTLPATFLIDENGMVRKTKYGAAGTYEAHFGEEITAVLAGWKGPSGAHP